MLLLESAETLTLPLAVTSEKSVIECLDGLGDHVARARARQPDVAAHRDAQREALNRGRRGGGEGDVAAGLARVQAGIGDRDSDWEAKARTVSEMSL